MEKVMAQGVFDILHPGHLHYLRESGKLGDQLIVIIARDSNVNGKDLVFKESERRELVDALEMVDEAIMGSEENFSETVEQVEPDTITLGYDQDHEEHEIKEMAESELDQEVEVKRIDGFREYSSRDYRP